jgi:hypothetical protein
VFAACLSWNELLTASERPQGPPLLCGLHTIHTAMLEDEGRGSLVAGRRLRWREKGNVDEGGGGKANRGTTPPTLSGPLEG